MQFRLIRYSGADFLWRLVCHILKTEHEKVPLNFHTGRFALNFRKNTNRSTRRDKDYTTFFSGGFKKTFSKHRKGITNSNLFADDILDYTVLYPYFHYSSLPKPGSKSTLNYIFHFIKNKSQERVICVPMKWKMGKHQKCCKVFHYASPQLFNSQIFKGHHLVI